MREKKRGIDTVRRQRESGSIAKKKIEEPPPTGSMWLNDAERQEGSFSQPENRHRGECPVEKRLLSKKKIQTTKKTNLFSFLNPVPLRCFSYLSAPGLSFSRLHPCLRGRMLCSLPQDRQEWRCWIPRGMSPYGFSEEYHRSLDRSDRDDIKLDEYFT